MESNGRGSNLSGCHLPRHTARSHAPASREVACDEDSSRLSVWSSIKQSATTLTRRPWARAQLQPADTLRATLRSRIWNTDHVCSAASAMSNRNGPAQAAKNTPHSRSRPRANVRCRRRFHRGATQQLQPKRPRAIMLDLRRFNQRCLSCPEKNWNTMSRVALK